MSKIQLLRHRIANLRRNRKVFGAVSLTAADVSGKAILLILTPYVANRMGPADFGYLSLCISAIDILVFVIFLGGPALLAAEYIRNGYVAARRLRTASIRLSSWVAMGLLLVSLPAAWYAPSVIPLPVALLVLAVSYVQGMTTLDLAYFRGAKTYLVAVVGQFSFAILNVILTVLIFEFDSPTTVNRLFAIAIAGAAIQLAYLLEIRRRNFDPADSETRRENKSLIVGFGFSLFPHVASHWLRSSVDRFVILGYAGVSSAGVYSIAVTLAMVPSFFFSAVSQQLQPYLYGRLKESSFKGFLRVQLWFVGVALVGTAIFYGFLLAFFDRILTIEYAPAKILLPPLIGGSFAQSCYYAFSHAAFYERRGSQISLLSGVALGVHLLGLGSLVLLGHVTLLAVSLVFLCSTATATLGMAILSTRIVRELAHRRGSA